MVTDILEYMAFGASLVSSWLYGKQSVRGPLAGIFTAVTFIVYGWVAGIYAAIGANIIFLAVHIKNWRYAMSQDEDKIRKRTAEDINRLADLCFRASRGAGWWHSTVTGEDMLVSDEDAQADFPLTESVVPMKLGLIHSEISEAMEADRVNKMDDKLPHRSGLECELADAVIRICDLAGALDLDLGGAIAEKMSFNKVRPDHKLENRKKAHGKRY